MYASIPPTARLPHPRALGASLLALLAATAVVTAEPPSEMPVTGRITLGGRPLAGAEVRIYGVGDLEPRLDVRSGSDGRFAVTAPSLAIWRVRVEAPGTLPAEIWAEPFEPPVALPPVDLVPVSELEVHLQDHRGEPVAALLAVPATRTGSRQVDPGLGEGWWIPTEIVSTDENGRVRIPRTTRGSSEHRWTLLVQAAGWAPQFFDLPTSEPVADPGDVPIVTRTLRPGTPRQVQVMDARERPLAGVAIHWGPAGGALPPVAVTDDRGRATLLASADSPMELLLVAPNGASVTRTLPPPVGDAPSSKTIRLSPRPPLRGRTIQDRTGRYLPGARVWLRPPTAPTRWLPHRALDEVELLSTVSSDPEGRFQLPAPPWPVGVAAVAADHRPFELTLSEGQPSGVGIEDPPLELALAPLRLGTGKVNDLEGRAVPDAVVRLTPHASPTPGRTVPAVVARHDRARTDREGRFGFANPLPGRHDLEVRASGFAPVRVPGVEIPEVPGEIDLGVVVLDEGRGLTGRVVAPDGRPLEGAEVSLTAAGTTPALAEVAMSERPVRATSDREGRFRLEDLPRGLAHLRVQRTDYISYIEEGLEIPPPEPLEVVLQPAGAVSGWILDPEGQPVAGALVSVAEELEAPDALASSASFATTSEGGRFEIRSAAPGRLVLTASAGGYLETRRTGLELEPGGSLRDLEVTLQRGASVSGHLWDPQGLPVAGALVTAKPGASSASSVKPPPALTRTGPEGEFELLGLTPGPYAMLAEDDFGRRARRELLVSDRHSGLELTLEGGSDVTGHVRGPEGEPVAQIGVTLLDATTERQSLETRTDTDGVFAFHGVPAGSYRLLVSGNGWVPTWYPEPLDVGVAPLRGLEVKIDAGATVRGRVEGVPFEDLSRAVVRLPSIPGAFGRLDFEGRFELRGIPAGERTLEVAIPGRPAVRWRVTVPPGAFEVPVELHLGESP